jgi:anti-sigma-K factor RskA
MNTKTNDQGGASGPDSIKSAVDNAKAQATLEFAINTLSSEVKRLTATVEKNNEKLERLSVLEQSHESANAAIQRAFEAIKKLEKESEDASEANTSEHKTYDKYIWMSVGFATAISIIWSVVGYRMNSMIDKTVESVIRIEQHMANDKMMSEHDVRSVLESRSIK